MEDEKELQVLRRRLDEGYANELAECKTGITGLAASMHALRSDVHSQLAALNIQIAKLPPPITLDDLEKRFILRIEQDKENKMLKDLISTFISKEEIRPLKVAIYSFWASIGLAMIGAAITLAFKS